MATLTSKGLFYTEELGAGLRVAQVLGLTTTAFFAGKTFAQSFSSTPALLEAPAPLLARQWKRMFDSDKTIAPFATAIGASIFGYMAYREPNLTTTTSLLYSTSTLLLLANLPYNLLLTNPITQKLMAKESNLASKSLTSTTAEAGVAHEETVHFLVDRWATINLGNAVLTALAALTATWAAIDRTEVVPAAVGFAGGANRMGK